MEIHKNIKYVSHLKEEDFVDFASWWADQVGIRDVNRPKFYNEINKYTLFFNGNRHAYREEEGSTLLVFEDFYCAEGRHSGAMEYTPAWVPYVYSKLPEELKEAYAKDSEPASQSVYGSADFLKRMIGNLQFETQPSKPQSEPESE